ncbi:MAG: metallophosphoesterase [Armatimonadota bacterium]|jgi:predicted phosphodiesterase
MRLVAVADLHYDDDRHPRVDAIARAVRGAEADVLVLAGDCAAEGPERIGDVLDLFGGFDGTRLMVPGNHDLWSDEPPFATAQIYEDAVPEIARQHGFHCLDRGPTIVDGTAFVGSMGWYDYEMRQREAPVAGLTVTPIGVSRGDQGKMSFSGVPGARETDWEALRPEDYEANGLIWQRGTRRPEVAVWNDALHIDWGRPAPAVAAWMADRLRSQIAEVRGRCKRVVGVTHFVPFPELAEYHLRSPRRAWAKAFLGSPLLGEALLEADDLALVIYGHRHRQEVREIRGVVTADAAVHGGDDGPLLLTLPD